jgi:hypothetical protein
VPVPEGDEEPEVLVLASEEDDEDDEFEIIEPMYVQARRLFVTAEVTPAAQVRYTTERAQGVPCVVFSLCSC